MSDMVEKVARSLCERAIRISRRWDKPPFDESMMPDAVDYAWRDFEDEARAAVEAMPFQEAIGLLESASASLWQYGANSKAREIDRFLDRVSPDSRAKIDAALHQNTPDTTEGAK